MEKRTVRRGRPPGTTTFDAEPALAFGAAVRVARLTQGIAQEELAAKAGIVRSHMGKIERGEHMPTLALILRIAAGLKLSAAELVSAAERNLRAAAHDSDGH
ncbi:helix-turn-helix domain-containing protein [Pseudomonas aeruginosa]|uniref:helix-turn-helix domain-containing protein n=1 Tax=Pseudomonas aeruginosa TaxID=287 RepID=UPI0009A938A1|nr:helix-turn-helix transcriptional regulator [Pseudomonas aeruginosa]PPB08028.1 XRE family transcriptional regulator [Pseudomonas aeruginosa]PPB30538.1 XRE family transcriptional regulator [Pseudomonas aeruginosa]PPB39674.1 XRE family transcriptional regulator [Pseudomonas aeruginosa]